MGRGHRSPDTRPTFTIVSIPPTYGLRDRRLGERLGLSRLSRGLARLFRCVVCNVSIATMLSTYVSVSAPPTVHALWIARACTRERRRGERGETVHCCDIRARGCEIYSVVYVERS